MSDFTELSQSKQVAFHERAYEAVRYKLQRVYDLNPIQMVMPDAVQAQLKDRIDAQIASEGWVRTRDRAIEESGLSPALASGIDEVARATLARYAEVFHLRGKVRAALPEDLDTIASARDEFYDKLSTRKALPNVMGNHVTNMSHYALRDLGLNRKSAHAIQGVLIGGAIRVFEAVDPLAAGVVPALGKLGKDPDDRTVNQRIRKIQAYWAKTGDILLADLKADQRSR